MQALKGVYNTKVGRGRKGERPRVGNTSRAENPLRGETAKGPKKRKNVGIALTIFRELFTYFNKHRNKKECC